MKVEIETKFKAGDTVYLMRNNYMVKDQINLVEVKQDYEFLGGYSTDRDPNIKYGFYRPGLNEKGGDVNIEWHNEQMLDIFATPEELFESLKENLIMSNKE